MSPHYYDWGTYGTNATVTTNYQPVGDIVCGRYYVDQPLPVKPVTAPAVKEEPVLDKGPSLVKRWREAIAKITGQPTKGQLEALPRLAGGSQESEIKVRSEHKKKITIERKVGVTRDKGDGSQDDLHRGKVELVRTMEGQPHLMDQIGIKVEAAGGSYVEVPYEQLLAALEDLRLPIEQQPTVEHEIEENGHA